MRPGRGVGRGATVYAVMLVATFGFAACNGDDDTAQDGGADVTVTAVEGIDFAQEAWTVSADGVAINYVNEDGILHTLAFDEIPESEFFIELEPGDSATETVDLEPGSYTLYCTVPGHRPAGMEGTLTVE